MGSLKGLVQTFVLQLFLQELKQEIHTTLFTGKLGVFISLNIKNIYY